MTNPHSHQRKCQLAMARMKQWLPVGVKAAKAKGKKSLEGEGKKLVELQSMWEIRQKDFALKEKHNKQKIA